MRPAPRGGWPRALALLLAAGVTGAPAAAQQPIFRSRVALGVIDISVVDRNGNPIPDPKPEDIVVRIDGRPREVRSFALLGSASSAGGPGVDPTARDTATNRGGTAATGERRLIVVLFDDLAFGGFEGRQLAESAARFIESRPSADMIGVFSMSGLGPQVAPTTDRAPAARALRQFIGQRQAEAGYSQDVNVAITEAIAIANGNQAMFDEVVDRECPPRDPPERWCQDLVQHQSGDIAREVRQRSGLQVSRILSLIGALRDTARGAQLVLLTRGIADAGGDVPVRSLAREAAARNVSVFALYQAGRDVSVQARRVQTAGAADRALERDGVENVVGAMGGTIVPVAGTADRHFGSLARQLDAIHRLGFALEPEDERAGDRRVQITTTLRGARVLPGERLMSFAAAVRETDAVASRTPEQRLQGLLAELTPSSAIPITARAFVARDPQGRGLRLTVAASADTSEPVRAAFALHTPGGARVATGATPALTEPAGGQVPLGFTAVVPPGDYVLRLAVLSDAGSAGTLAYPFRARLTTAGDLVLSDPLVWTGDADEPRHSPSPRLSTGTGFHARVEVYPAGAAPVEGYSLVIGIVAPEGGAPLLTTRVPISVGAEGTSATAWLPVDALSSGDYVLLTTLEREGESGVAIERAFSLEKLATPAAAVEGVPAAVAPPQPAAPRVFDAAVWLGEGGLGAITDAFGRAGIALSAATLTALTGVGASSGAGQPVETLLVRTVSALRAGHLDLAAISLQSLTRELRGSPAMLVLTGAVYAARGHDREAVAAWATAEAAGTDDPALAVASIDALRRLGLHGDADVRLKEALGRWPSHAGIRARIAR